MQKANDYRNLILGCCITGIVMLLAFFFLYQTYIQNIIYDGRGYSSDVSKSGGCDRFPMEPGNGRM
jgi:hypothetical protein